MSAIRKYIGSDWKKFGETNISDASYLSASGYKTSSQISSVQDVLDDLKTDVDMLKRNVSWLALHGGGGTGSGSGSSRKIRGTVTLQVDGSERTYSSGESITMTENKDLIVNLQRTPSQSQWTMKLVIKDEQSSKSASTTGIFYIGTSSITIPYANIKEVLETNRINSKVLTVNCTYVDSETGNTYEANWGGYIFIPEITTSFTFTSDKILLSQIKAGTCTEKMTITAETSIVGSTTVTIHARDAYSDKVHYTWTFIYAASDTSRVKTTTLNINEIFKAAKRDSLVAGQMVIYGTIENAAQGVSVNTTDYTLNLLRDGVNAIITGIKINNKDDEASYNIVNRLYSDIQYDLTVLNTDKSATTWQYASQYHVGVVDASTTSGWKTIKEYSDKFSYDALRTIVDTVDDKTGIGADGKFTYRIMIRDSVNSTVVGQTITIYSYCKLGEQIQNFIKFQKQDDTNPAKYIKFTTENFKVAQLKDQNLLQSDSDSGAFQPILNIRNRNITSGFKAKATNKVPRIRFSNECIGYIEDKVDLSNLKLNQNKQWSIGLSFKSDEYSTDDHIIFGLGVVGKRSQDNVLDITSGISVKPHGVYVNANKVLDLADNAVNNLTIVYSNTDSSSWTSWTVDKTKEYTKNFVKIYLNGVVSYVDSSFPYSSMDDLVPDASGKSKLKFFFGGIFNNANEEGQYCDFDLYSFNVYNKAMNDINVLAEHINQTIMSTYADSSTGWNFDKKDSILKTNICTYDEDNCISSTIFENGLLSFEKIFTADTKLPPTDLKQITDTMAKQIESLKSMMNLPIVVVDAKTPEDAWTFSTFITEIKTEEKSEIPPIEATDVFYWDIQNSSIAIKAPNSKISIQGTSSAHDYIKNIDITLAKDTSQHKETLLTIRDDWAPENVYTLKSDIVDSSHSNNASIGKFINTLLPKDNSYGYDFDEEAKMNVEATKKFVPNCTIKHTVEGFPVLLFINFKTESGNDIDQRFLGIYSFNIGRDAYRNLGFTKITGITYNGEALETLEFPAVYEDCTITEQKSEAYWIENSNNSALRNADEKKLSAIGSTDQSVTTMDLSTSSILFWQDDDTILDSKFELKYTSNTVSKPSAVPLFKAMVQEIIGLPIEGTYSSLTANGQIRETYDFYGSYDAYAYDSEKRSYVKTGSKHTMYDSTTSTPPSEPEKINAEHARKYFVLAMLFGLRDNFEKNVSIRYWKDGDSSYLIDFYDLDTSLGITNQGAVTVSPSMWIKHFINSDFAYDEKIVDPVTHEETIIHHSNPYDLMLESYDSSKDDIKAYTNLDTTCESNWNKLWLSLDSRALRSKASQSKYSYHWFKFRKFINEAIANFNEEHDTAYTNLADFFFDEFFVKQTSGCGQLLFDHDYKMKYMNVFDKSTLGIRNPQYTGGSSTRPNTLTKLHGRRIEYSRKWLKERISFLDSYFYWRSAKQNSSDILIGSISDSDINQVLAYTSQTAIPSGVENLEIKTNKNAIISTSGATTYNTGTALAIKNKQTNIYIQEPKTAAESMNVDCITSIKDINITDAKPIVLGSNLGNLETFYLDNTSLGSGDFVSGFKSNKLKNITLSNIKTSGSTGINLNFASPEDFEKLIYIDIHDSVGIQSLTLGSAPMKELNINGSGIVNLEIHDQHYIEFPEVKDCKQLQTITVRDCDYENRSDGTTKPVYIKDMARLQSISLQSVVGINGLSIENCSELTSILINDCTNLSSVYIDGCNKLTSHVEYSGSTYSGNDSIQLLGLTGLKNLEIKNTNSLNSDGVTYTYPKSFTISKDSMANVTNFNIAYSSFEYINIYKDGRPTCPTFADNDFSDGSGTGNHTFRVFDIKDMTNLTSVNFQNNSNLKYLRVKNVRNSPFNMDMIGDWNDKYLINIRRIFGNLRWYSNNPVVGYTPSRETTSYSQFSLFGHTAPTTWAGHATNMNSTIWDSCGIKSGFDASKITDGYYTNGSFTDFIKASDAEADYNTNVVFDNLTAYSLRSPLGCCFTTWFDNYYILYRAAINNLNPSCSYKIYDISEICYPTSDTGATCQLSGHIPTDIFYKLDDLTAINYYNADGRDQRIWQCDRPLFANYVTSTTAVNVTSPTVDASDNVTEDNGIFSKLINVKFMRRPFLTMVSDNNLFRRKTGNYAIDTLHHVCFDGDYFVGSQMKANYFSNLTSLGYIENSFQFSNAANTIDITNIRIPTATHTIYRAFNNRVCFKGDLIWNNIFSSGSNLQNIHDAFYGLNSELTSYRYGKMFSNTTRLTGFGQVGLNYDSNVFVTKYIYMTKEDDYGISNKSLRASRTFTVDDWNTLCRDLFYGCYTSIKFASRMFYLAKFDYGTYPTNNKSTGTDLPYPNGLFDQTTNIQGLRLFMYGFGHRLALQSDGFANCTQLRDIYGMFQTVESIQPSTDDIFGITTQIPKRFFYHGGTTKTKTVTGFLTDITLNHTNYSEFKIQLENSLNISNATQLYNTLRACYLTEATVKSIVSDPFEIWNESKFSTLVLPLASNRTSAANTKIIATIEGILASVNSASNWRTKVIKPTSKTITYTEYNNKINCASYCFHGNKCIQPFTNNSTIDLSQAEVNEDYCPFNYTIDAANTLTTATRNDYQKTSIWIEDGRKVTATGFESYCRNIESLNYGKGIQLHLNNGSLHSNQCAYRFDADDMNELRYICSPDLCRYFAANCKVDNMFYWCSFDWWRTSAVLMAQADNMTIGLKGRIPPNLLKKQTTIESIAGMFKINTHITGYKRTESDGSVKTYLIPPEFLSFTTKLNNINEAFYRTVIPPGTQLAPVFQNCQSTSQLKAYRAFANCFWLTPAGSSVTTHTGIFTKKNLSNIDYLFAKYITTSPKDNNDSLIKNVADPGDASYYGLDSYALNTYLKFGENFSNATVYKDKPTDKITATYQEHSMTDTTVSYSSTAVSPYTSD